MFATGRGALHGSEEFVIYVAPVGKIRRRRPCMAPPVSSAS